MNKRAKQEPQIRVQGFDEAWEQRKLGDLVSLRGRIGFRGYKETDLVAKGNGAITFSPADIDDMGIISFENNKYLSWEKYDESPEIQVEVGDILFTKTASIGKVGFVRDLKEKATINPQFALLTPKDDSDGFFIYLSVRSDLFMKQVRGITGGSSVPTMSQEKLKELYFFCPSKLEQKKIGAFFLLLDNLITLHQREYEKLKNIKHSMLEKMFPKTEENFPEIRFKGFSDPWKPCKLKDIAYKVTAKNIDTLYVETLTNSAELGVISQKDYFDHDISNLENIDGYYIVENNDFVYNPRISTLAPVGPINRNKLGRTGVMSPLYTVFRTHDVDEEYVEWFFKSSRWHKFMYFNGDTGARSDRFAIKDDVFFEMPIPIPHIDEQRKIGEFFCQLDRLIELENKELEKIKHIKTACLEKMFV